MRICPRCKSKDVQSDMSFASYAQGSIFNNYKCNNCGFSGQLFPEIEKIKKKGKKKK